MTSKHYSRLYIPTPVNLGDPVHTSPEQAHYVHKVMRFKRGDRILIFNGIDGEWLTEIETITRKSAILTIVEQTREQPKSSSGPSLFFAPIKKSRMTFLVEKAAELGVSTLCPVTTQHTNAPALNLKRTVAHVIEASEQCRRLTIPDVMPPAPLKTCLDQSPDEQILFWLDETGTGQPLIQAFDQFKLNLSNCGFIIGPEGGFVPFEQKLLASHKSVVPVSLGPIILRSETAVLAALANWQQWSN